MDLSGRTRATEWKWDCGGDFEEGGHPYISFAEFKRDAKARSKVTLSHKQLKATYDQFMNSRTYINSRYQVDIMSVDDSPLGPCMHLSIKRRDKEPIHDWRDLQSIKNSFVGDEGEAIEVYPAMSRIMDTANQYHLWCFPAGVQVPFGIFSPALVSETEGGNGKQRAFKE